MDGVIALFRAMAPVDALVSALAATAAGGDCGCGWPCVEAQRVFVESVLHDPVVVRFPPARAYTRAVLKAVVACIERAGCDVDEELLDALVAHMADDGSIINDTTAATAESTDTAGLAHCSFALTSASSGSGSVSVSPSSSSSSGGGSVVTVRLLAGRLAPVGLVAWPAGFLLAEVGVARGMFAGLRVLELGSGVGITGIALARWARVAGVCMTDFLPTVLANLAHNVQIS
jgi:hypothetical protein